MKLVLDTYGLIKWLLGEPGYEAVEEYLSNHEVYMSAINFGETYYRLIKNGLNNQAHSLWINKDIFPIRYVESNWRRIKKAAEVKAWHPVAYADAFCIALGMEMDAPIITGDPEFKKVKEIELIWVGA